MSVGGGAGPHLSVIRQALDFQYIDALLRSAGHRIYCERAYGFNVTASRSVGSTLGLDNTGLSVFPSSFSPMGSERPERSATCPDRQKSVAFKTHYDPVRTVGKTSISSAKTCQVVERLVAIEGHCDAVRTAVRLPTLLSIHGARTIRGTRAPSSLQSEQVQAC
eukprot:COSAG02_NODE_5378_length_4383_cov_2.451807_4_plen_164_part_00